MESSKRKVLKYTQGAIQLAEEDIPEVPSGHVLIRTAYATINPADLAAVANVKTEEFIVGIEGTGIVIKVGEDVEKNLLGKKVSFMHQAWGTHAIRPVQLCMVLDDSQDLQASAAASVNPLTACGQLDYAKKNGVSAVIMTAASSTLAKQFFKLCKKEGIKVINIVRKDEYVAGLKEELGADYVVNQTSPYFMVELKELIGKLKPTLIYEYVGGDLSDKIFRIMPPRSILMVVGNLSKKPLQLDSGTMIYHMKNVVSFNYFDWILTLPEEEASYWMKLITDDLKEGGAVFGSKIIKTIKLDQWKEALEEINNLKVQGKLLLDCK